MRSNTFRFTSKALVAGALGIATAVAIVPGAASASVAVPTRLSAAFTGASGFSMTIVKGQTATVVGHLFEYPGTLKNLANVPLNLYARTSSAKPWVKIATDTTGTDGKVKQSVKPNYSTQLQWRFNGDSTDLASSSPGLSLAIGAPPTRLTITPGVTLTAGTSTTVVGHLVDAQSGADLSGASISLWGRTAPDAAWGKIATGTTAANGKAGFKFAPATSIQVQWRYGGSSIHAASNSPVIQITVKPAT